MAKSKAKLKKSNKKEVDTKLQMISMDIANDRLEQLKKVFPEVFAEGKVDFDKLKAALGENLEDGPERYGLNWADKRAAFHNVQTLSTGTLRPVPEESVNFDSTENLIIEGDNLEVLKLLQKSYYGKIKMIYIDPPYNTGNEFIYPDDFKEGLQTYLRYTKQVNEEGIAQTTNKETSGRFHSIWMNMMYPRLYLARNLLKDDGVVFVSIDDNEVGNLRSLMDEIFGEENIIDCIIWKKRYGGGAKEKYLISVHEYILMYAKNISFIEPLHIPLSKERVDNALASGELEFLKDNDGNWSVHTKQYLKYENGETREGKMFSLIDNVFTQHGTNEILDLFGDAHIFPFPKPTDLIKPLVQLITKANTKDIVLDFFAGSGATAHAVLDTNQVDDGNRKFILVQLPEPTELPEYPNLTEICKERVRRVISKLAEVKKNNSKQVSLDFSVEEPLGNDFGFKVSKLDSSNFSLWDGENAIKPAQLGYQLRLYADHVKADRSLLDILYEVLLKTGYPLTAKVKEQTFGKLKAFNVENGELVVCLADKVTQTELRAIIKAQPQQVICLDSAFQHNDQLKTNTVLEMKSYDITFHTV